MTPSQQIVLTDSLGAETRHIIELAKPYDTIILLYNDDFSDRILANWTELDRLNLPTRRIGQVYSGIEVHSFGLDSFPNGTVLELHIRETSQNGNRAGGDDFRRTAYKSLLNELTSISVQVRRQVLEPEFSDLLH